MAGCSVGPPRNKSTNIGLTVEAIAPTINGGGVIAIGADADLTLWDPGLTRQIRQADLHHGCDYTPYEGMEITGWPVRTILRGRTIAVEGHVDTDPEGQELSRTASEVFVTGS